ncbi:MAG: 50S ribosomal protein L20 [Planctomycetes bacterium]|nr:50S ribosomal protein L20 [Planctomycetota bacterium]NUQ35389.1 50S ribosomal protein L20 [Planctomycetaceae bacterium]
MSRATNAVARHRKHMRMRRKTRGNFGAGRNQWRQSKLMRMRGLRYAWFHRFKRRRDFRRLWITRMSAAIREHGISYSRFIAMLKKANIQLSRKSLSELAIRDPKAFAAVVETAKKAG